MAKPIILETKEQLDVYINPRRQELLRQMQIENKPVTPKELSRRMGISTSSVQHHLRKLEELGVVELHHTEQIRNITAQYYWMPPRTISLGRTPNSADNTQRLAIMQNAMSGLFSRYAAYYNDNWGTPQEDVLCTMDWGVMRLQKSELPALQKTIMDFLAEHESPNAEGIPFEYAMLVFPAQDSADA